MTEEDNLKSIAAIDLGSNSFHMVVARLRHGEVRILDRYGEKVQLAAGLDAEGNLDEASQQRALECLGRFNQRIRDLDASSVQIVGTNALRAAKNRRQFLQRAQEVIGFPIEIISGREEARLIYLGVSHTQADDDGRRLVIDIGGGSTELILGERFEPLELESLHMGCVSYRERYFADGKISKKGLDKAITEASREIFNIQRTYRKLGWQSCIGASGSIKAIQQALITLGFEDGRIDRERMELLRKHLCRLGSTDALTELGVKKERLSIFPAGFAILYACFDILDIHDMAFSHGALREGLLYDIVGRIQHEDVRERSLRAMQQRYHVDPEQAARVAETVDHAWQQIAEAWQLEDKDNQRWLRWAAQVYEIGLAVAHTQYHKHGAYLLQYSDMPGFTRLVQSYLAVLVRSHRRKISNEPLADFDDTERERLRKLIVLFRLAVVLTASRKSAETQFKLKVKDTRLCLRMGKGWLAAHPLTQANLEAEQQYLLKQGFTLVLE